VKEISEKREINELRMKCGTRKGFAASEGQEAGGTGKEAKECSTRASNGTREARMLHGCIGRDLRKSCTIFMVGSVAEKRLGVVAHGALDRFLATDYMDFTDGGKMKRLILLGVTTIFVAAGFREAQARIAGKVGSFSVFGF